MKNKDKLITTTLLIGLATTTIYFINKIVNKSATVKNLLKCNTISSNYYKWRFGNIYYTVQGSGSPLLLIHDVNPFSSSYEWKNLVKRLAQTHTVYTIDLLGCGRSDKPKMTYTNFLYVQMLNDFIETVIKEKTNIIANGLSTSFVITACNSSSNYYGDIVLINPKDINQISQNPIKRCKVAKLLLELPILGTFVYNILCSRSNVELLFTEKLYYNPFNIDSDTINYYYEGAHIDNGDGKYLLGSIVGRYMNFNIIHALSSINNNIFIIGGSQVPNISTIADNYAYHNPVVEFISIPHTKELPHLENPDQVLEHLSIFLG